MALRAQKKRQGGSSTGTGSYDPRRPNVATGVGTTNPSPLGKPPTKGKGIPTPNTVRPTVQSPSAAYMRKPMAPVGATTPTPSSTSTALRTNAESAWGRAQTSNRDAIFRAVMQLGDPTLIAKYQADPNFAGYTFNQDPNSVFASLGRQEEQGLLDIDKGANAGNTFFSGQRLNNRQLLTDETGRQRLAGSTGFEDDLKSYAAALGAAQDAYRQDLSDADQMDIDAALEQDRIAREELAAAVQAEGPVKGLAAPVPIGPSSGPPSAQRQAAAARFKAQQEHEAAVRRAKSKKKK